MRKKKRGFALLSPEERARVSAKGGKSAQAQGLAHTFTLDEQKVGGAKGGKALWEKRRIKEEALDFYLNSLGNEDYL